MKSLIVLISNPAAAKASNRKTELACRCLRNKGHEVESVFTRQRGEAESIARDALGKNPSLIIAAGGDGTFNEVMNGMAGSNVPMAILPLGTTNVLAKELGIPEHMEKALDRATGGRPKVVSLGRITVSEPPARRYFCLMAGIGFDGAVVHGISERLKRISGKGAYIYSGMKTLLLLDLEDLRLTVDGEQYSGRSAIIGKSSKYGGNFRVAPGASLNDPNLYVCIFRGKRRIDVLRYVLGVVTGRHTSFEDVEYKKAAVVEVRGVAHAQIDGDYLGMTPATIEVAPDILRLVY
ncbi:MAG: diacylglycerol kinase family protein [Nitrospirota bacterium]